MVYHLLPRIPHQKHKNQKLKKIKFLWSPIHKGSALRLIKTIESKKTSQGQFLVYNVCVLFLQCFRKKCFCNRV